MKSIACAVALTLFSVSAGAQTLVSTEWLAAHRLDSRLVILEVGDRATFERQHIAGAHFLASSDLLTQRDGTPNELPDIATLERTFAAVGVGEKDRVVLYAHDLILSARAFFTLDYLGHGNLTSLLDGGFQKWTSEGHAIESGAPPQTGANFQSSVRADVIVRRRAMEVLVECLPSCHGTWAIVDARPAETYLAGHIAGTVNVPWQLNLTGGVVPVFRPVEELRVLYDSSGVPADASVVTYCQTSMQASIDYFVLRYLGRDVVLYDGSYAEWNRPPEP